MEREGILLALVVLAAFVVVEPYLPEPGPSNDPARFEVTTPEDVETVVNTPTPTPTHTPKEKPPTPTPTPTPTESNDSELIVVRNFSANGVQNSKLRNESLDTVEFLADLPRNQTKRDRVVTEAATEICDTHNDIASDVTANASALGNEGYRNTYRVSHTAAVLHDQLGADLDVGAINSRMKTARGVTEGAERYAPIFGSYNRLHNASCAVKAGEPGSKEDFYVASAAFATDVVLVKENVAYKASFAATGYASRQVGLMRLANVCGYKCVGLVQSEIHWGVRGGIHGGVSFIAEEQSNGNLSIREWNETTRKEVNEYLENTSDTVIVNETVVTAEQIGECVQKYIELDTLGELLFEYGREFVDGLREIRETGEIPDDISLSSLTELNSVRDCVKA